MNLHNALHVGPSITRESEVWCTFADREARTQLGHCEFCGSTGHSMTDREQAAEYRTGEDEIEYADEG